MTDKAGSYEDLIVWQRGISVVKKIYRLTSRFPSEEKYGLTSQMRRSAVSIPSNIAEGQARHTTQEFIRSISNSEGSLAELSTQLVIARELEYCEQADLTPIRDELAELRKMLNALRRKLQAK